MKASRIFIIFFCLIISLFVSISFINIGYQKFIDISLTEGNSSISLEPTTRLRLGFAYITINIFYLLWILINRPIEKTKKLNFIIFYNLNNNQFANILKASFIFLLIAFLTYPPGSDIYLYLHYGLMAINGINPFVDESGIFSSELSAFIRWNQSSTYGPVSQAFFILAASVVKISPILAIYIFKFICLLFHIFNAYLIWFSLKLHKYQNQITSAYILNPLLLFEHVSVAHVDVFICTSLLVFVVCWQYNYYVLGILAIWVGFLTKTLPIIWLPLAIVFMIKRRYWQSLAIATTLIVASIVILQRTILPNLASWKSLLNPAVIGKSANSLHELLKLYLNTFTNLEDQLKLNILSVFSLAGVAIFLLYYIFVLFKQGANKDNSEKDLFLSIGWVTLVMLLFATPWLMPWYVSILLPITALYTNSRSFVITSLAFYLSSSCCYALVDTGVVQSLVITGLPLLALIIQPILNYKKWLKFEP